MSIASTSLTTSPHARGSRGRATAATIAPRTWDIPVPDLVGLHVDSPGHQPVARAVEAARTVAVALFFAGSLWLTIPWMTPAFLFTWGLFVVLYVAGRVSWDLIRRS